VNYAKSISKEEINELPMFEYHGEIVLIENLDLALQCIEKLSREKFLGFDTETRPSFSKGEFYPVALLQLASEKCAYLFRLNKFKFPKELGDLLAREDIVKAGVAIHDDLKGLQKLRPFTPGGFIDVAKESEKIGITTFGLRALTAIFLGHRLSKAAKVTNWEKPELTEPQIMYAACDAVVGLGIYLKLFPESRSKIP
jgi:ribonuclease D